MLRGEIYFGDIAESGWASAWRSFSSLHAPTPFQTPEWQSLWMRHFGGSLNPLSLLAWDGNDLVGCLNLTGGNAPWRPLRQRGVGPSDYLEPTLMPGTSAAATLYQLLTELSSRHLIDLHQLSDRSEFAMLFPAERRLNQSTCYVLELPNSFEDSLARLGKDNRYRTRKLIRDSQAAGISISLSGNGNQAQYADDFFRLHRLRWKSRGLPGAFLAKSEAFHREWLALSQKSQYSQIMLAHHNGAAIGALYLMHIGDKTYYYQAGMDPKAEALRPGAFLVAKAIEMAILRGDSTFDFMRGDEPYKLRWRPQQHNKNCRILLQGSSVITNAGSSWNNHAFKLENAVRNRLEGKSLRNTKKNRKPPPKG
jgi:CelD/BcsL family acetyltransferase involved in cellulose biosynthesis